MLAVNSIIPYQEVLQARNAHNMLRFRRPGLEQLTRRISGGPPPFSSVMTHQACSDHHLSTEPPASARSSSSFRRSMPLACEQWALSACISSRRESTRAATTVPVTVKQRMVSLHTALTEHFSKSGTAHSIRVLLCCWHEPKPGLTLVDISTGERLHAITPGALQATYTAWLQQVAGTGSAPTPLDSIHTVWFMPSFSAPGGVAMQSWLREGIKAAADWSNSTGALRKNTGVLYEKKCTIFPEGARTLISLRTLRDHAKLSEKAWPLIYGEQPCITLLGHLEKTWCPAEWCSVLTQMNTCLSSVTPCRNSAVVKQPTKGAPNAKGSATRTSTRLVVTPPIQKPDATANSDVTQQKLVNIIRQSLLHSTRATTHDPSAPEPHVVFHVVGAVGAASALRFTDLMKGGIVAETSVDVSLNASKLPSNSLYIPIFLVTAHAAERGLQEKGWLRAQTCGQHVTVRPHVIRLHQLEVLMHRASLRTPPSPLVRGTSKSPPGDIGLVLANADPFYDVSRKFMWRSIGVHQLLTLAVDHLTADEWRAVLLRGSDFTSIKSHDEVPRPTPVAAPLSTSANAMPNAAAPEHRHVTRMLSTMRSTSSGGHGRRESTPPRLLARKHLDALYGCPQRAQLEVDAARQCLPLATREAGGSLSGLVVMLQIGSSNPDGIVAGRRDNPFAETNTIASLQWATTSFKIREAAPSSSPSLPAEVMSFLHAEVTPVIHERRSILGTETRCAASTDAPFWQRGRVLVAANAKHALLMLRRDATFANDVLHGGSASGVRLWCVLYAQHVLSGFSRKYDSVQEVLKEYVPPAVYTTMTQQQNHHMDMLAHVYHCQVRAAALGRCLLTLLQRMEGLFASTVMEHHGMAIAPRSKVDERLKLIEARAQRADATVVAHANSVFDANCMRNFNWRSSRDMVTFLFGGGALRLHASSQRHPIDTSVANFTTPDSEPSLSGSLSAFAGSTWKPVLHRYLCDVLGGNHTAPIVMSARDLARAGQERSDEWNEKDRLEAMRFLSARTCFVVVSIHQVTSVNGAVTHASVFIPHHAHKGGGELLSAKLCTDEPRDVSVAAEECAAGWFSGAPCSNFDGAPAAVAPPPGGALPQDVERVVGRGGKRPNGSDTSAMVGSGNASTISLVAFRNMLTNSSVLREIRNEMLSATCAAFEMNDERRALLERCPPTVVFVIDEPSGTTQLLHRHVGAVINSCIAPTICTALEITAEECVAFVDIRHLQLQQADVSVGAESEVPAAIPDFQKDFEDLEMCRVSSPGSSSTPALRDALYSWISIVHCDETTAQAYATTAPAAPPAMSVAAVPGVGSSTTAQHRHLGFASTKRQLLETMHAAATSVEPSAPGPYFNWKLVDHVAVKWLRNLSAIIHPQQSLFIEGWVWRSIRTHLSNDPQARRFAALRVVDSVAPRTPFVEPQSDNHHVVSVGSETLQGLMELWREHKIPGLELLEAIESQRSVAKLTQLFQPDRFFRCSLESFRKAPLIRGEYIHHGTNTGRLASQSPCVQNLPKDKLIRELIVSRFGGKDGVLIEADYSQLEVVVLALLAGDRQMIDELKRSVDFHCLRVGLMKRMPYDEVFELVKVKKSPEFVALRQKAKVFSFQRQYGAGVAGIAASTGLTREEVGSLIAEEERHYPQLTTYYRLVQESVWLSIDDIVQRHRPDMRAEANRTPSSTVDFLLRVKSVVEPSRYFPVATGTKFEFSRDARLPKLKNHPVQGFAGELVQMVCGRLVRRFNDLPELRDPETKDMLALVVNTVHDCVWVDCHRLVAQRTEDEIRAVMPSVCQILGDVYRGSDGEGPQWLHDVPFPISIHQGKSLADISS